MFIAFRMYPNDGVTLVWAPVLFYYTKPPTRPPQHGHVTTASHQQQAAGDVWGLETHRQQYQHQQPTRKGPNDTCRVVWAICKFFIYFEFGFLIILMFYCYQLTTTTHSCQTHHLDASHHHHLDASHHLHLNGPPCHHTTYVGSELETWWHVSSLWVFF